MDVFSYGKKKNNDLLVITNQHAKHKDLHLWTSEPNITKQFLKYEDFVNNFQGKKTETILPFQAFAPLTFDIEIPISIGDI
jgi:hypothetical protein